MWKFKRESEAAKELQAETQGTVQAWSLQGTEARPTALLLPHIPAEVRGLRRKISAGKAAAGAS